MSDRVALVWDEALAGYDFGPQHPLQPVRVLLTVELSRAFGLIDARNVRLATPTPAHEEELALVHDRRYIEAVKRIGASEPPPFGGYGWGIGVGDNPAFRDMHEASALVAGASLEAARRIKDGSAEHAFNPAGGLHHAMAARASGFCIYNDPAIAIAWLLNNGYERIAYVDVDVHHGDGVQAAFYDDPRVLTISLHESGEFLFPGTGFADETGKDGSSVNVALPPLTPDDAYQQVFSRIVPPLIEAFAPDLLVTQLGCDTHATDPLAHLALTTRTYRFLATRFHALAHAHTNGRWLAVGGGGYQIYNVVPRAWTIYFAEIAGAEIDSKIPEDWRELARDKGAPEPPESMDDPGVVASPGRLEQAAERANAAAEATARAVFGFHGLH